MKLLTIVFGAIVALIILLSLALHDDYHDAYGEKIWTNDIISLSCSNGGKIEFIETLSRAPFPSGKYHSNIELIYIVGDQRRHVDNSYKRTPVYTKLYDEDALFSPVADLVDYYNHPEATKGIRLAGRQKFPTATTYKNGYVWDVFISPQQFSEQEYHNLRSTIFENEVEINEAIANRRQPEIEHLGEAKRHPMIGSIVYLHHDYEPWTGLQHSLDVHFNHPSSEIFISQHPPNIVELVLPTENISTTDDRIMYETCTIGIITDDQEHVLIKEPTKFKFRALVGEDCMAYYELCVNDDGKNLFHYFKPISWHRQGELKESQPGNREVREKAGKTE